MEFESITDAVTIDPNKSVPYPFEELVGNPKPTIHFKPATEDNKTYSNAMLKIASERGRRRKKGVAASVEQVEQTRRENILLVSKFCATGWDNVKIKGSKKDVPYSTKNVISFLSQLPHWMFDRLYMWLSTPSNFLESSSDDDADGGSIDTLEDLERLIGEDINEDEGEGEEEDGGLGKS